MGYRDDIIDRAKWWADPGVWRPFAFHLAYFFKKAGAEAAPSDEEAREALARGGTGVKVQGRMKQWCGVFACCVVREAGVSDARWTLLGGKIRGLKIVWGHSGLRPGDIALIQAANHHFIVTDIDESTGKMRTVEGNTPNQCIRVRERRATEPYAYYRIPH